MVGAQQASQRSGVQQGSPLSPLLYVIAAQPLASHLKRQSQLGVIRPIIMPTGHNGSNGNKLSNSTQRSNPGRFYQTELPTMTP